MTWTNVWPTVKVTGLPFASKNRVGEVSAVFFQVPLIVLPLVAIHAGRSRSPGPRGGASSSRR
jgi:hypothetical protein